MEKIQFDSGVKEYRINGTGVLKFNPGDPNVYARFLEAAQKIQALEQELAEQAKALEGREDGAQVVKLMAQADKQMKQVLGWVFGNGNDFDKILGGVNLLAVAGNGERVVTNLFHALQPILVAGAESCAREKTRAAVRKAKLRRGEEIATPVGGVSGDDKERVRTQPLRAGLRLPTSPCTGEAFAQEDDAANVVEGR
jgi:hypothetical protein